MLFGPPPNEPTPQPPIENLKRNYQLLVPKLRTDFELLFTEFNIDVADDE